MVNFFPFFLNFLSSLQLGCHDNDDTPKTLTHKKSNDRFSFVFFSSYKNYFTSLNFYNSKQAQWENLRLRLLRWHFRQAIERFPTGNISHKHK